jgi:hypothetical protein
MAIATAAIYRIAATTGRSHGYRAPRKQRQHQCETHPNMFHCNSPFCLSSEILSTRYTVE